MGEIRKDTESSTLQPGSMETMTSSTRSCTPTSSSNSGSERQLQSSKSSQTSAGSGRVLATPNNDHHTPYMPNIDLLHIGAQFAQDFAEDNGHIGVEGRKLGATRWEALE
ncbi:hypothetical protein L207DRAFT_581040 [Hyaloscypha variabilis F]|uniref:Uncharacterized protein n=1 Tax=Hyaloscypha variabilis (strain UAMH 11265 / GT02V1 / F) TaxID=1149755 RepID=A0A2J6RV32_HYAVF|nr:hypothetical protein L207DRAFT_581040 [Hyaloscypha variabilis F]